MSDQPSHCHRPTPTKLNFGRDHRGATPLPRGRPPNLSTLTHRPLPGRSIGGSRSSPHFDSDSASRDAEEIRRIVTQARAPFVPEYRAYDPNRAIPLILSPLQQDLRRLRELATTQMLEFLTLEIATSFLSFLSNLIIHEIPSVAHLTDPIALKAGFLLDAHILAVSCLKTFLRAKLAQFEAPEFRMGLVAMWDSPDPEEQHKVSSVVAALCLAVPGTDELLLPIVRGRLASVVTGLVSAQCVGPACEFLHRYHSEALHYPTDPEWFMEVCPALFACEKLPGFFGQLSELCAHYYDIFDQLPVRMGRFLLAHWPRANPAKIVQFVEHAGNVFGRLTDAEAGRLVPALFGCLTEALCSGSDAAVQAVVALLARRGFLGRFRISGVGVRKLREALKIVEGCDVMLVAHQAAAALEKLGIVEGERLAMDGRDDREEGWLAIWEAGGGGAGTREEFVEKLTGGK